MGYVPGRNSIEFTSGGLTLKGDLFLPPDFVVSAQYPALVVTGSWTTVKEQMAGLYAARLAEEGYVALAFDFRHYGESAGEPRHYENPPEKIEDIRSAIAFVEGLPFVTRDRIGGVGVCASGGYMAHAAGSDDRLKTLVLVVPWLHDPASVPNYYGGAEGIAQRRALAAQAQAHFQATGETTYAPGASNTDPSAAMFFEGNFLDYYLNPARGGITQWGNRFNVMSWEPWLTYDGIGAADGVRVPLLLIASDGMATPDGARQFFARVTGEKDIVWSQGAQLDFYDQPRQVTTSVGMAAAHLARTL